MVVPCFGKSINNWPYGCVFSGSGMNGTSSEDCQAENSQAPNREPPSGARLQLEYGGTLISREIGARLTAKLNHRKYGLVATQELNMA